MPLLWISLAFLAGAVVPIFYSISWQAAAVSGAIFGGVALFEARLLSRFASYNFLRKSLPVPLMLLAAGFTFGMLRGETGKPLFSPADLGWYHGRPAVTLLAIVSQPIEQHDRSTLMTVSVNEILFPDSAPVVVKGDAMLLLPAGSDYAYGDRLEISGNLDAPPEREDFSYRQYLENRGVYSYMTYPRIRLLKQDAGNPVMAVIYQLRDQIASTANKVVPQPQAAFLSGILVGRDEAIPDSLKKAFQATGTSHLVAISGFNITILSGLILALTMWLLPRSWAVFTAIFLVAAYSIMAGANPSVVRAAVMGGLAMVGKLIGRTKTAVNSLGLAAVVMVMLNPLILRDIGFQLSVLATGGILVIGAPANDWFIRKTTRPGNSAEMNTGWSSIGEFFIITLAAQIATLPVLLYNFHRFPVIGLLVNPLVLPVQSAAMTLGGAAVIAGMVFLPLGKFLGLIAWVPLAYTTRVVEIFSDLGKSGSLYLNLDLWQTVGLGLTLALAVIFWKQWTARAGMVLLPASFIGLTGVLAVLLNVILLYPDGKLHVEVFRQGSDLSTFIHSPGGQRILVTNRPGDKDLTAFVDRRLPILQKKLDMVVIPNPSTSSLVGLLDSLSHFQPGWTLINPQAGGYRVQTRLDTALSDGGISRQALTAGVRFDLGGGAILSIISAGENGSGMDIVWGIQRIRIIYGEPDIDSKLESNMAHPVYSTILDHPSDAFKAETRTIYLSVSKEAAAGIANYAVPEGG
ncbi:MAG: ComEC/Rec2 family competence protein, partial [Leptolinea sp.]